MKRPAWRRIKLFTMQFLFPVLVALLVRTTVVQAYHVPSGSMENTLRIGDVLLAEKLTFGTLFPGRLPGVSWKLPSIRTPLLRDPRPGEIVILEHPEDENVDLIKRCVAVEDQWVEIRNKRLFVDGVEVSLTAVSKHVESGRPLPQRDVFGPYRVPPGHIFVMGDNRDHSYDSRYFGAVSLELLRARPFFVYFQWNEKQWWKSRLRFQRLTTVEDQR